MRLVGKKVISHNFYSAVLTRSYRLREEINDRLRKEFFDNTLTAFKEVEQDGIYASLAILNFLV